jgi:exosortase/archaeosortase
MLFVAGIGVASLVGSTMITGTFMSSIYAKYYTGVLVFIMVVLFTYGGISFTQHGKGVTITAIIISAISFVLFYFQKKSMF